MNKIQVFTANWCPECIRYRPIVQQAIDEGFQIEILDIKTQRQITLDKGVKFIPTTLVVDENGTELYRVVGSIKLSTLKDLINQYTNA